MAKIRIEHEVSDCEFCGDCGFLSRFVMDLEYNCQLFGKDLNFVYYVNAGEMVHKCKECINATVEEH